MPQASQSPTSPRPDERRVSSPRPHSANEPRHAFRAALGRYKGTRLAAIRLAQGAAPDDFRIRPSGNADEITEHLDDPAAVQALFARLSPGSRLALEPLWPHRIDLVLRRGAFTRAANPGNRACAGHPEAARAGLARSRSGCEIPGRWTNSAKSSSRETHCGCSCAFTRRCPRPCAPTRPEGHLPVVRRSDRSGPRAGRPRGGHSPGGPVAAGRGRAAAADPARSPLQTRSRSDRPGPRARGPDRRLVRPPARLTLVVAGPGPPSRADRARRRRRAPPGGRSRILDRE